MAQLKTQQQSKAQNDADWFKNLVQAAGTPLGLRDSLVGIMADSIGSTPGEYSLASHELRCRANHVVQITQAHRLPVFPVAVAPLFGGWRLLKGSSRFDYAFCNLAEDPLFAQDPDGFPIPSEVLRHLRSMEEAACGSELDLLYVVHEVEKGALREGEDLNPNKLIPPSPQTHRRSKQLGSLGNALWLGAALPLLAGAGLGLATAAIGFAAMAPLGLDPMLLGAVVGPGRPVQVDEPAVWFYLAHWRYTDTERKGG